MRKPKPKRIEYAPPFSEKHTRHSSYKHVRWVENVSCGLRFVGYADKLNAGIDHTGWYTSDDNKRDELYRGVVYKLPSRDGKELFVYGYEDPNNDDCALLCFDLDADSDREAARFADSFAESNAEREREYHRAWDAGRKYDDLGEEIKDARSEALALCKEMRMFRRMGTEGNAPTICQTLRASVLSLRRQIVKAYKEREELFDNFGREPGFVE